MRLLVAIASALALAGPAGGRAPVQAPGLFVLPLDTRPGVRAETEIDLVLPGGASTVSVEAPAGYAIGPARPPGTAIGSSTLTAGGRRFAGELFVADRNEASCKPGPHEAVWTASPGFSIALDSNRLAFCLPPGTTEVDLDLVGVLTNPIPTGTRGWNAALTPRGGPPVRLRCMVSFPQTLILRTGERDHGATTVTGRLVAGARPRAGVAVHVAVASRDDLRDATDLGVARTRGDGTFALRAALPPHRTLTLIAYVNFYRAALETIAPPPPRLVQLG